MNMQADTLTLPEEYPTLLMAPSPWSYICGEIRVYLVNLLLYSVSFYH